MERQVYVLSVQCHITEMILGVCSNPAAVKRIIFDKESTRASPEDEAIRRHRLKVLAFALDDLDEPPIPAPLPQYWRIRGASTYHVKLYKVEDE